MNEPKGHHFLPKNLYLKPFIFSRDNPRIWVHEKGKEPDHRHWDHVAKINELHSIRRSTGELDRSLERYLAEAEGDLAPIIDGVVENRGDIKLSPEERQRFAVFVGMMFVRTPRYFEQNKTLAAELKKMTDSALQGDKQPFLNFLKKTKTDSEKFFKSVNLEKVSKWINDPQVYDHFHLIFLESHALAHAKVLYEKMTWTFLVPEEGTEFITSDNPVSICHVTEQSMRDAYAIGDQEAQIYFPIGPKLCFQAYHGDSGIDRRWSTFTYRTEKRFVDNINTRTAAFAQKYAYSHTHMDLQPYFNSKDLISVRG